MSQGMVSGPQKRRLQLIVVDIEGCLIPGARHDWSLQSLAAIAAYNRWSRRSGGPQLTLASGRPAQYVEAVGQAVSLRLPAICENGAFIFETDTGMVTPLVDPGAIQAIRRLSQAFRSDPELEMRVAHGKDACISLIPEQPAGDMEALAASAAETVDRLLGPGARSRFQITYSAGAVDITPAGATKGAAVQVLLQRLGLNGEDAAAVGDGGNDLSMFATVGVTAAPANGMALVKEAAQMVAGAAYGEGTIEILEALTGTRASHWEE